MQAYSVLNATDYVKDSRQAINDNFATVISDFSGTVFPTSDLIAGMKCNRTDQKKVYFLQEDLVTWTFLFSYDNNQVSVSNAANAKNATNAINATNDSEGNKISETYLKSVPNYVGAKFDSNGQAGLVPAATSNVYQNFLRADGTWAKTIISIEKQDGKIVGTFSDGTKTELEIVNSLSDFGVDASADELNKTIGAKDNLQNQIDSLEFLIKNFPAWWLNHGNGSDGEFNPDSDTTISSTKNFTNVNIPSGVTVTVAHGARLLCTGAFTNAGTIQVQAVNMAGAGGAGAPDPGTGGTGGQNTNDAVIGLGGNGGAGGSGHKGTRGGAGGAAIGTVKRVVTEESIITTPGGSGAGGGGGASHGGSQYVPGPPGGAGGAGGGSMLITCTEFNNTGTITANGTNGNNGRGGGGGCGGGGGGGGGAGGTILVVADTVTSQGTITATGGAGGSGGGGDIGGGAQNGATGAKGTDGIVHVVAINQS